MKFIVKNKETGKIVSPRNYYFVINQNGELYTFNGAGQFDKTNDNYIYELSERQAPIEPNKDVDTKQLIIGDVINWVAITDKQSPKLCTEVLVVYKNRVTKCRYFDGDGRFYDTDNDQDVTELITHWAAFPEPPCL